jgi:pSer/pThr/pTyr-binding forkhead associated (FHA) protein
MRLVIETGGLAGQDFSLARPVVTLGRGRENDIVLLEHGVSRQHARVQRGPQGWMLTDLGSTNGTSVNGQQIRAHKAHLLRPGDRVTMGSAVLLVQEEAGGTPSAGSAGGEVPEAAAGRTPSRGPERRRMPRPALMVGGALLLVIVLAGIVVLLILLLQPKEETVTTPTPGDRMEQMMTSLPVPTEFQDVVTSVVPLIPTGLPFFPPGATATPPPPGAAIPESLAQAYGWDGAGRTPSAGRAREGP